jgi:formylglycine-generating enzyme required for sulfatase activity
LQRVSKLGLVTPHPIFLPPLSLAAYRDVIIKPAAVYTRQVARLDLEPELVEALVKGASGADALPLLAFTLQRLFLDYAPEQTLTKAHYDAMGGIEGSIDRKLADAKTKAGTVGTDANLRRLILPALATWDTANATKRLVANETYVIAGDRAGLAPLANALVEARLLTRGGGTLEVAHEALLRRHPISGWLEQQKDALRLRDDVLREAKEWADAGLHDENLVRRGGRLRAALGLATNEDFKSALAPAAEYLKACGWLEQHMDALKLRDDVLREAKKWADGGRHAKSLVRRGGRLRAALGLATNEDFKSALAPAAEYLKACWKQDQREKVLGVALMALVGMSFWKSFLVEQYHRGKAFLQEQYHWRVIMGPRVLTVAAEKEKATTRGAEFTECATGCPTMVVVPAGKFMMGSPSGEQGRYGNEGPRHPVTIAKPFAVGKTEVTFAEWDACVAAGACAKAYDNGWGRDNRPVINVGWDEAKQYVAWLSGITGKEYRLLSEAEWEYAARAGTTTAYSWGDEIGGVTPTVMVVGANGTISRRRQSAHSNQMLLVFMTCTATSMSWSRTSGMTTTAVRLQTEVPGCRVGMKVGALSAAVPGTTFLRASAPPAAAGSPPTTGAATSVSGWPER